MSERNFWRWLQPLLPRLAHVSRVESGDTAPGIPDVYYQLPHSPGWFELKFDRAPRSPYPFAKDGHGLRTDQKFWIRDCLRAGGQVHIVSKFKGCVAFTHGSYAREYNEMSRSEIIGSSDLVILLPLKTKKEYQVKIYHLMRGLL